MSGFSKTPDTVKKFCLALGVSLALCSASALADGAFSKLDKDGNGQLSKQEFRSTASDSKKFSGYDSNRDGMLGENEWNEADFDYEWATWDGNSDGFVDADEFNEGTFDYFDENEDGHWDGNEWDDAGDDGWLDV